MRRLRNVYENPDPPNLVQKMALVILAQRIKRLDPARWEAWHRQLGRGPMPDHYAEEMAFHALWKPDNNFQREHAAEAMEDAWALFRHLKDIVKADMNDLERRAQSASWWW